MGVVRREIVENLFLFDFKEANKAKVVEGSLWLFDKLTNLLWYSKTLTVAILKLHSVVS